MWFQIATEAAKPHSCCHLQQLEQIYHLEAQATAQAGRQCLKAGHHILNQGGPIQQVDPHEISWETSPRSCTPCRRGDYQEGADSEDIHILVTQRGEPLERSPKGINIPPCTHTGFQCLQEGLPKGVLPGLHFDIFPPTTTEIQINSGLEIITPMGRV